MVIFTKAIQIAPAKDTPYKAPFEIEVIMIALRLLVDTPQLFRIVSFMSEDDLLLIYPVPVAVGQFKDFSQSWKSLHSLVVRCYCFTLRELYSFLPPPPSSQTGFV